MPLDPSMVTNLRLQEGGPGVGGRDPESQLVSWEQPVILYTSAENYREFVHGTELPRDLCLFHSRVSN